MAFDFKGHETNCQEWPKRYLKTNIEPNQARNDWQELLKKAAKAFAWPFMSISYLQTKFEQNQARNGLDTNNGRCSLCLAFDFESPGTKHPFHLACFLHTPYQMCARMDRIEQSTSIRWLITVHSQGQCGKRFLEARGL